MLYLYFRGACIAFLYVFQALGIWLCVLVFVTSRLLSVSNSIPDENKIERNTLVEQKTALKCSDTRSSRSKFENQQVHAYHSQNIAMVGIFMPDIREGSA